MVKRAHVFKCREGATKFGVIAAYQVPLQALIAWLLGVSRKSMDRGSCRAM